MPAVKRGPRSRRVWLGFTSKTIPAQISPAILLQKISIEIFVETIHSELLPPCKVRLSFKISVATIVSADSSRIRPRHHQSMMRYLCEHVVVLYMYGNLRISLCCWQDVGWWQS
jgi:hypothetical protein